MKLFIFSFKEHERITKLSALLAQQNLSGVSEVIYVWDDFHPVGKNHPFGNVSVINFSSFPHTDLVAKGWFRQQFVKLQLHKVTTDDSFYVLDGDTFIRNPIDLRPNKMFRTDEYHVPYFDFIRESLRLEKNNDFSFISPLLRIERDVLVKLEEYSMSINGRSIFEMLVDYEPYMQTEENTIFSEAEIYGTFATQVLHRQYEYIDSQFIDCASYYDRVPDIAELFLTTNQDLVWYGSENAMPERFWKECYPKYFTD